jgi:hypothetical protein
MTSNRYIKKYIEFIENAVFEMSNLQKDITGLPALIYISSSETANMHGPRIKVQKNKGQYYIPNDIFYVSISDNPEIVEGDKGDLDKKGSRFNLQVDQTKQRIINESLE